ncbi:MAG TPA: phosphatidate cytidylyltransferase [Candidatus Eisenbacteria bacterium]|nr:phosphatidate cytidylyltransferase [Candidatus Eisenbacteria bacterium]
MSLANPVDVATITVAVIAAVGLLGGALFAVARRGRADGLSPRTALSRAGSYAGLAILVVLAARAGVPGIGTLIALLGSIGILEWARLFDLPAHHRLSMLVANLVLVVAVGMLGVAAADWLVGGLVLVGAAWPVIRADTGRAVRDLGFAAVGFLIVPVLLVHGVALAVELGGPGIALFVALAVACAASDVGAFIVGRTFGRTPLAPRLSPNKTRAGVAGNIIGAAVGLAAFLPALAPTFGAGFVAALVPIVAAGSLWGDLLESAVKREAGAKDAGAWLPGFGGILDRIDSLIITVALTYWAIRILAVL